MKDFMRILFGTLVGWVFIFVLLVATAAGIWYLRYETAEIRGIISGEERIESAPSRIVNYERYFDLCASVQSLEGKLDAQMELLAAEEASDNPDRNQLARLRTNIAGLKGMRESEIRQYNADARKSYTRARFRASELPFQLPADPHEKGERTSCK